MGAPDPLVSVVVPVRDGASTIGDCLRALLRSALPAHRFEVVVVDNGSRDATAEIVEAFAVRRVTEPRPGLSHARNRGIEASRGAIVAFTDADCLPTTGWLSELLRGFEQDGAEAVAGDIVAFPPRTPAERYVARRKPSFRAWSILRDPPWMVFMSAALRREVFERVGGFDPRFRNACEDIDLSWRLRRAGVTFRYRPRAVVLHRHRATPGTLFRQQLGYGRAQAVLQRKYAADLPWCRRQELAAWADLGRSGGRAARAWLRAGCTAGQSMDVHYPLLDFVRKLGQRLGFVQESLRGSALGWGAAFDRAGRRNSDG